MKSRKRLLYYLLLNVIISACTTFTVLAIWDRTRPFQDGESSATSPGTSAPIVENTSVAHIGATAPATVTQTIAPTDTPIGAMEYVVRPGDTLGLIAEEHEVSVEELLSFNGLTDADAISVGQIIYVPVTPQVIPSETLNPTRTVQALSDQTPSRQSQEARVVINSVIGVGDLASERVFLSRTGDGVLSLAGWQLADEDGNVFTFPQLELFEGGAVNVWTTGGEDTVVDLHWDLSVPVWQSGETATLRDATGKVHATYHVP